MASPTANNALGKTDTGISSNNGIVQSSGSAKPAVQKRFKPGIDVNQGKQTLRGYSITKDQLENLSHIGWFTATLSGIATGFLSFSINLKSALDLSSGANQQAVAWWSAINSSTFVAAIVFYLFAAVMLLRGQSQKSRIIENTEFSDGSNG